MIAGCAVAGFMVGASVTRKKSEPTKVDDGKNMNMIIAGGVIGALAVSGLAVFALPALGFSAGGVAAGSVGAGVQSMIGNVAAGSMFSAAQSAGVLGIGDKTIAVFSGIGGAAGIGGVYAWIIGRKEKPQTTKDKILSFFKK